MDGFKMLRFLTAGESHGPELVAVVEGYPAGFDIDLAKINNDLARRQMMTGRGQPLRQRGSGFVIRQRAGIGNRQHRDAERDELF